MTCLQSGWPEPVVRVQSLAEGGITAIPERYIKPVNDRPILINHNDDNNHLNNNNNNIPVIDLQQVYSNNKVLREEALTRVSDACRDWGFFQVVNHGVSHELMSRTREVWRKFFNLPLEMKQELANNPGTYEGYGSRLGVEKGAILDWSDYFFLNYLPLHLRNPNKWPTLPTSCRDLVAEYGNEAVKLCGRLMKILSLNLGLGEDQLQNAFGGENIGATMRANFYPKCPQPDLTLGLSSHSDPGGITLLLPDENVAGLQVRLANGSWVTVKPVPNAFIVNIGDQIQVLSNAIYKSVEHRVVVNSTKEHVSLAFFYNPKNDILIEPIKDLITEDRLALYQPMTYDQYKLYIRIKGPSGKKQVESLKYST